MRKEHKEILIKDLASRLPYGVKIKFAFNKDVEKNNNLIYVSDDEQSYIHNSCLILTEDNIKYVFNDWLDECKPYLRPMSSMTEEEKKDWRAKVLMSPNVVFSDKMAELYDFCNSHYLDYRKVYDEKDGKWKSMIEMGLAIEAPKNMYKFK